MEDGAEQVVEHDPAEALPPISQHTAQPQPEGRKHPPQRSACRAEHDPDPQVDDADPRRASGLGRRLPLAAELGEESAAEGAVLVQDLGAAVAVAADRGSGDQHAGSAFESGERLAEEPSAGDAALAYLTLDAGAPAPSGDAAAGEVDRRVDPLQAFAIDRLRGGLPRDFAGLGMRFAADQAQDLVASRREEGPELLADQPGAAG